MNRNRCGLALLLVLALAACSTDVVVSPLKVPAGPKFALSSTSGVGNYIVLMKGSGIAKGFAERVASLGGTVTWAHADAGFATVSGLSDAAAVQLSATNGVGQVQRDLDISLNTPVLPAEADVSEIGDPTADSQGNPATGLRYVWQWNMRLIHADVAWAAAPARLGSPSVTVAILDTGIDYDAPDLTGLVDLSRSVSFMDGYVLATDEAATNPAKLSDNDVTTTYFPSRNAISDYNGHGTNVASQVSSNAFALAGVTSYTTLIGVKVLGSNGSGSLGRVLSGVIWAADHGANIANVSLGGDFPKSGNGQFVGLINKVFNYAKRKGMLIVVSAGNNGIDLQHNGNEYSTYCDAPHVVCVSSVGPATALLDQDEPAYYTNFGKNSVDVAAPGGNADAAHGFPLSARPWGNDIASWVWSYCSKTRIGSWTITPTVPPAPPVIPIPNLTVCTAGNRLSGYIGTSQAAPHVAGLAALLVAEYGPGQPQTIKHLIEASVVPLVPAAPEYGRGLINVQKALGL
jgi:subtilisin family serine protease